MKLNRRNFLKISGAAGGGLLLSFYFTGYSANDAGKVFAPNAFLRIDPSNLVTCTIPRPEMGQGVRTSLALVLADEVDCEWKNVRVEQADLDPERYGDQYVGGSSSIRDCWEPLRNAGATARQLLLQAAARQWNVPVEECSTQSGKVVHTRSDRSVIYGEIAEAASREKLTTKISPRDPKERRMIGRFVRHLDVPDIVTGRIEYGIDTVVKDQLVAVIARAPSLGARLIGMDDTKCRQTPGVKGVIRIDADAMPSFGEDSPLPPNGVAVLAVNTWVAMQGRDALRLQWSAPDVSIGTSQMREEAVRRSSEPAKWTYRENGNVEKELLTAAHVVDAVYEVPLLAHATMEPMNCTASVSRDHAEIWAPTQNPQSARDVVRLLTNLPEHAIVIHPRRMGGGFGRRFYNDYVAEAVYLSQRAAVPVHVVWTREDDMRNGFPRPAGYHILRGAVDSSGRPSVWTHHLINASRGRFMKWQPPPGKELKPGEIGRDDYPSGLIPNLRIQYTPLDSPIPCGQWRAVEDSANVFVIQSFLSELANAAGKDELQINLELLSGAGDIPFEGGTYDGSRLRNVFETAARKAGWGNPLPSGHARGIAGSYSHGAYVAQVAEVEVTGGNFRVHRIVAAADCGTIVNRSGAEAQVQGGILFALSALRQEITVEKGAVVQENFSEFPLLRIQEAPEIEVELISNDFPPHGMGEGAVPPTLPAVCNAIFRAGGKRIRKLPIGEGPF